MRHDSYQRGVSLILVVVVLSAIALIAMAAGLMSRTSGQTGSVEQSRSRLTVIAEALNRYASLTQRLPCPSSDLTLNPDDGLEVAAGSACTNATGTVPWKTLGLSQQDALDAWGWKISYRVFSGATGLTQASGASMVNCDTVQLGVPPALAAGGLCGPGHDNTDTQFLAGKGLQLKDFGTVHNDVAFVLISHGPSGLGAYTTSGARKDLPTSADELANINTTTAAAQFVARAASSGVAPDAATHFDDILIYQRIADFVKGANLSARDWPEPPPPPDVSQSFTVAAISAATGNPVSPGSIGEDNITLGPFRVYGFGSGGGQDLAYDVVAGVGGLGVAGGGNLMSSAGNESMLVRISKKERWFAVTLNDFGTFLNSGKTYTEQVQFIFLNGGVTVGTIQKAGCASDGGLASYAIDVPGGIYDSVFIRPLPSTEPSGTTNTSALLVSEVAGCLSSAIGCQTNLAIANPASVCP